MKKIIESYQPDQLQEMLNTSESYSDVLRKMDLFPTSANIVQLKNYIRKCGLSETQLDVNRKQLYKKLHDEQQGNQSFSLEDVFNGLHPNYRTYQLGKRLIKEGYKENKCEICGITKWMNKPISLQLHHKDGNAINHQFENLQILCPNCHSQTDSFAGKNSKKPIMRLSEITSVSPSTENLKKVPKEVKLPPVQRDDLKYKIRNTSFLQIGREFGVTDNAIRKWCDRYGLPRRVDDIKKLSDQEWESI